MTTFDPSRLSDCAQMEFPWMSSAEASPARISASQDAAQDWPASDPGCGPSSPGSLARYDRGTSSWRTSQLCLDGDWERFSETWPRSGTMRSGIAYPLPPLAHRTYGTGFGSLPTHSIPTPTASDHIERSSNSKASPLNYETNKSVTLDRFAARWPTPKVTTDRVSAASLKRNGHWSAPGLAQAVELSLGILPREVESLEEIKSPAARAMWPTPSANEFEVKDVSRMLARREELKKKGYNGNGFGMTLAMTVAAETWATPSASDHKGSSGANCLAFQRGAYNRLADQISAGGQLNPDWVEALMGLPVGWTRVE
jgi:hypothetical protein